MAKSDSFFGLRRGSTKTLTFSVLKGKQITKDRVEGGRNPRTPEQMVQRMCMATASAAYAQMKQIVDHSFEGITYGQTTMSEFIRVNSDALRQNYLNAGDEFAYNPYRDRLLYPGAYIMSRGSAAAIRKAEGIGYEGAYVQVKNNNVAYYTVGLAPASGGSTLTADSLMAACGVNVGDMATACVLYPEIANPGLAFSFLRVRFLKAGTVELTAQNYAEYLQIESPHAFTVSIDGGIILINVSPANFEKNMPGAWCIIHSLKSGNGWLRSNESMVAEASLDISPIADDALATYPVGPSYVLNGGDV